MKIADCQLPIVDWRSAAPSVVAFPSANVMGRTAVHSAFRTPHSAFDNRQSTIGNQKRGFSLLELMIGIVILGLGLIMVATMFPVAWMRARVLNEFTVERATVAGAHETVRSVTRVSTPALKASSFLGDLTFDPFGPTGLELIEACPNFTNMQVPDWVHALNTENIVWGVLGQPKQFVSEDSWRLQDPAGLLAAVPADPNYSGTVLLERSFFARQLALHQRLYPTMTPRALVDAASGAFLSSGSQAELDRAKQWDNNLDWHRYVWAVLHRLQKPIQPSRHAVNATRTFDMYYVLLRRTQPTFRYARQNPTSAPDPCSFDGGSIPVPKAQEPDQDVMFPVAWRVQVEFPDTIQPRLSAAGALQATGIPTEIIVPPKLASVTGTDRTAWFQMFPYEAWFVDEISGEVFEVTKRRLDFSDAANPVAVLTLQREVFLEEIDLLDIPPHSGNPDPRCSSCGEFNPTDPKVDYGERIRTVWVFPPPVQLRASAADPLAFDGTQPVVSIDVRTLAIGPTH